MQPVENNRTTRFVTHTQTQTITNGMAYILLKRATTSSCYFRLDGRSTKEGPRILCFCAPNGKSTKWYRKSWSWTKLSRLNSEYSIRWTKSADSLRVRLTEVSTVGSAAQSFMASIALSMIVNQMTNEASVSRVTSISHSPKNKMMRNCHATAPLPLTQVKVEFLVVFSKEGEGLSVF